MDGSDEQPLDVQSLYRTFTAQLSTQVGDLPEELKDLYEYCVGDYGKQSTTDDEWRRVFMSMTQSFDHVYLVVDALDECEESIGLGVMIDFIQDIWKRGKRRHNVHILTSSRDLQQIREVSDTLSIRQIHIQGPKLASDIRTAVKKCLSADSKFSRWPQSVKDTIETSLTTQAQGS